MRPRDSFTSSFRNQLMPTITTLLKPDLLKRNLPNLLKLPRFKQTKTHFPLLDTFPTITLQIHISINLFSRTHITFISLTCTIIGLLQLNLLGDGERNKIRKNKVKFPLIKSLFYYNNINIFYWNQFLLPKNNLCGIWQFLWLFIYYFLPFSVVSPEQTKHRPLQHQRLERVHQPQQLYPQFQPKQPPIFRRFYKVFHFW